MSATTSATGWPAHSTLTEASTGQAGLTEPGGSPSAPGIGPTPARSAAVNTAATPGASRAALTSTPAIRACATGLRTTNACSVPSGATSSR